MVVAARHGSHRGALAALRVEALESFLLGLPRRQRGLHLRVGAALLFEALELDDPFVGRVAQAGETVTRRLGAPLCVGEAIPGRVEFDAGRGIPGEIVRVALVRHLEQHRRLHLVAWVGKAGEHADGAHAGAGQAVDRHLRHRVVEVLDLGLECCEFRAELLLRDGEVFEVGLSAEVGLGGSICLVARGEDLTSGAIGGGVVIGSDRHRPHKPDHDRDDDHSDPSHPDVEANRPDMWSRGAVVGRRSAGVSLPPVPYEPTIVVAVSNVHPPSARHPGAAVDVEAASVRGGERVILGPLDWTVWPDERWLVLGANGSGKTTLLRLLTMYAHSATGSVTILGERLGATDARVLRRRIGYLSAALAAQLRPGLSATEVVMTARYAALEPWWHTYEEADRQQARVCLDRFGVGWAAERSLGSLSSGEQQRVLLARAMMNEPGIVLLDEPSARLDLGGREHLVGALAEIVEDPAAPPVVLVTHHLDEVPAQMTHAMVLRDGGVLASGPIDGVLTAETLSEAFDVGLEVARRPNGRWTAWSK